MREVRFFLFDDLLFDRACRSSEGGSGFCRRLDVGGGEGLGLGLGLSLRFGSVNHIWSKFFVIVNWFGREGRGQVHAFLQSVFAFPLLVGGFIVLIEVAMLLVQGFGQAGCKERLVVGKIAGHTGGLGFENGRRGLDIRLICRGGRLTGATAILRDRLARQDHRLIAGRRAVFGRARAELALNLGSRGLGLGGLGTVEAILGTVTIVAIILLKAAATTTTAAAKASAVTGLSLAGRRLVAAGLGRRSLGSRRGGRFLFKRLGLDYIGGVFSGSGRCRFGALRLRATLLRAAFLQWRAIGGDDFVEILVLVFEVHEIGNVEEGIAFQANVHESGLHAGEHAGDASFVDGSG